MFNFRGDRGASRTGRAKPEPASPTHEDWGQEWGEDWRGDTTYGGAGYYGDSRSGGQSFNSAQRVYPGDPGYREHPTRPQTLSGTGVGSRRPVGPKNYERPDERVLGDVCDRLAHHPDVDVSDVTVDVDKGLVKLGGTVGDRRQKYIVEEIADAVYGVKDVENQIRVRRPGEGADSAQRDSIGSWASGSETGEATTSPNAR